MRDSAGFAPASPFKPCDGHSRRHFRLSVWCAHCGRRPLRCQALAPPRMAMNNALNPVAASPCRQQSPVRRCAASLPAVLPPDRRRGPATGRHSGSGSHTAGNAGATRSSALPPRQEHLPAFVREQNPPPGCALLSRVIRVDSFRSRTAAHPRDRPSTSRRVAEVDAEVLYRLSAWCQPTLARARVVEAAPGPFRGAARQPRSALAGRRLRTPGNRAGMAIS